MITKIHNLKVANLVQTESGAVFYSRTDDQILLSNPSFTSHKPDQQAIDLQWLFWTSYTESEIIAAAESTNYNPAPSFDCTGNEPPVSNLEKLIAVPYDYTKLDHPVIYKAPYGLRYQEPKSFLKMGVDCFTNEAKKLPEKFVISGSEDELRKHIWQVICKGGNQKLGYSVSPALEELAKLKGHQIIVPENFQHEDLLAKIIQWAHMEERGGEKIVFNSLPEPKVKTCPNAGINWNARKTASIENSIHQWVLNHNPIEKLPDGPEVDLRDPFAELLSEIPDGYQPLDLHEYHEEWTPNGSLFDENAPQPEWMKYSSYIEELTEKMTPEERVAKLPRELLTEDERMQRTVNTEARSKKIDEESNQKLLTLLEKRNALDELLVDSNSEEIQDEISTLNEKIEKLTASIQYGVNPNSERSLKKEVMRLQDRLQEISERLSELDHKDDDITTEEPLTADERNEHAILSNERDGINAEISNLEERLRVSRRFTPPHVEQFYPDNKEPEDIPNYPMKPPAPFDRPVKFPKFDYTASTPRITANRHWTIESNRRDWKILEKHLNPKTGKVTFKFYRKPNIQESRICSQVPQAHV